jgi:CBS domain-containing protein
LAEPLRAFSGRRASEVPRFCRQLAAEVLRTRAPLDWLGRIDSEQVDGVEMLDLKLRGTAIFVSAARLRALALGLPEVGTRQRFEAIVRSRGEPLSHDEAAVSAFEFLQMLRLRVQLEAVVGSGDANVSPNRIRLDTLNDIDRRILKESLRIARQLQQQIELDYMR